MFDLPDHAIFLQSYACGMAKICGHGRLCASLNLGGPYKASIVSRLPCPARQLLSLLYSLDDGLAICAGVHVGGRPWILCAVIRETRLDRDRFRLAVSQKSMGGSSLPAPPIVAKRARTAAKLWVFGWPRFSQRNWRTSNPTSVCRQVAQDLSKRPPLQLQLELAARRLCSFSATVIHL